MPVTPMNALGRKGRNKVCVGQVFGRWQVLSLYGIANGNNRVWLCACRCGETGVVRGYSMNNGHSNSCGCLKRELAVGAMAAKTTVHGMSRTPVWITWSNMLTRCRSKRSDDYAIYGGRGISVCPEWDSFETFYRDMGGRPPGKSLDRIDTDGNYEPGNCRWATSAEQNQNKRNNKLDWEKVAAIRARGGLLRPLAEEYGVHRSTINAVLLGRIWKLEEKSGNNE